MPFIYCTECGYKNIFTTRKAKFCAGCGQSFAEEEQSAQGNSQNDPSEGIPNIQKLEYTVDAVSKNPTIGDLINTKKQGSERLTKKVTGSPEKLSLEQVEAQSLRECGSSINRSED